jgi:hypothetical protein
VAIRHNKLPGLEFLSRKVHSFSVLGIREFRVPNPVPTDILLRLENSA